MKQYNIVITNKEGCEIYETTLHAENGADAVTKAIKRDLLEIQDGDKIKVLEII